MNANEQRETTGPTPLQRWEALGGLAFAVIGVAALVAVLIRSFPRPLSSVAFALAGAWALWFAVGRKGMSRLIWIGVAVLLGIATLVDAAIWTKQFPGVLVAVFAFLLSGALSGRALTTEPHQGGIPVGAATRPALIINPRSGDGTATRTELAAHARKRAIEVFELGENDDLVALAHDALDSGADVLGMAGGDGSLAVVAAAAMDADVPFVCIPAGTRNHFALDLGLDMNDPIGALDAFGSARLHRIDVGDVNGRMFLNNVSMGVYGEAVASERYREHKVAVTLDALTDLIGPDGDPLAVHFTDGTGESHDSAVVVHVSNNAYEMRLGEHLGARNSLTDGELGVVAVIPTTTPTPPRVTSWSTPKFDLQSDAPVQAGIDGEAAELDAPVRFVVRPLSLSIRLPKDLDGAGPHGRPAIGSITPARLWRVVQGRASSHPR